MAYLALLLYTVILFIRPQEWVSWMLGWPLPAIIICVALIAWGAGLLGGEWKFGATPQDWLMLGLFCAALLSHVSHFYFGGAIESFRDFGKTVLLYFLIVSLVNTERRHKVFLVVVILGSLFLTTHVMLQEWTGTGFGGQQALMEHDDNEMVTVRSKAFGMFEDPNDLALALVTILPFALTLFVSRGVFVLKRLLGGAAAAAMIVAVYLTNSRGGWVALGVMGLAFLFTHFSKKVSVALAAVAFAALIGLGPSRMGMMSSEDDSIHGRFMAWADGNQMLKQSPVFGVGQGLYTDFSDNGLVAHNSFVHCYAELGLFGYFFWLAMVCASLKDGYALSQLKSEKPSANYYAMIGRASVASLIGFLAAAFFLSRTYFEVLYILFGIVAAARILAMREECGLAGSFRKKDGRLVLAAEFLSIPAIYLFLHAMMWKG